MIEKLLRNRKHIYRSFVVHRHYKLIYYIEKDTVYIADLWDTRREPVRLSGRVKR